MRLRLRGGRTPARSRELLRDPPGSRPRALHAGRPGGGLAHAGRGLQLAAARARPAPEPRPPRCAPRRARDRRATTSPACTSAPPRARCSPARTRASPGTRSRATCRRSRRSRSRRSRSRWQASISPRRSRSCIPVCRERWTSTPGRSTRRSNASTSAGPACATRLCEPGPVLRRHINVYVDRQRAELGTALESDSRVDVIAAISGG